MKNNDFAKPGMWTALQRGFSHNLKATFYPFLTSLSQNDIGTEGGAMVTTTTDNQRILSGSPRESRSEPIGMPMADLTSIAALAGLAVVAEKYQALMPDILAYREQHDIQILHQKRENEESKTQELRSAFNLHVAWSFCC